MKRIEQIRNHPIFVSQMKELEQDERDREFCGHDMNHLLSVARIGYVLSREEYEGQYSDIPQVIIYAAALLHDIGRHLQYADGIPHNEGGAQLAETILRDTGFSDEEIAEIVSAIKSHRSSSDKATTLSTVLYDADKKSRACYLCNVREKCNWPREKMNLALRY